MRALWDYPPLPYVAVAPWPQIIDCRGFFDWAAAANHVEDWLEHSVGPRYATWAWGMWTLHNTELCGVTFARESHCSLFLLRFSR